MCNSAVYYRETLDAVEFTLKALISLHRCIGLFAVTLIMKYVGGQAKPLVLLTLNHKVPGLNPTKGGVQLITVL